MLLVELNDFLILKVHTVRTNTNDLYKLIFFLNLITPRNRIRSGGSAVTLAY